MNDLVKQPAIPLPMSVEDMLSQRKVAVTRNLNDYLDDIHISLWGHSDDVIRERYRAALDAVWDEDAIEGSLAMDNGIAATIIRDYAKEKSIPQVATKKLATIVKSMNVVLRRYGMSRKERRMTVGGKLMLSNNGNESSTEF